MVDVLLANEATMLEVVTLGVPIGKVVAGKSDTLKLSGEVLSVVLTLVCDREVTFVSALDLVDVIVEIDCAVQFGVPRIGTLSGSPSVFTHQHIPY
jgi:hypothetical protein